MVVEREIGLEIGLIEYSFTVELHYVPGVYNHDPRLGIDDKYIGYDIVSDIYAYHLESGEDWWVTEKAELDMIKECFDDAEEFENYISGNI